MSLVKLLPAWFHAIADYAVGALLIIVPIVVGGSDEAVATGIVVGAVVLLVSMATRYPLGVFKILPFTVHSAGDYLAAALLIVAPFAPVVRRQRQRPERVLRGGRPRGPRRQPDHELPVQPEAETSPTALRSPPDRPPNPPSRRAPGTARALVAYPDSSAVELFGILGS